MWKSEKVREGLKGGEDEGGGGNFLSRDYDVIVVVALVVVAEVKLGPENWCKYNFNDFLNAYKKYRWKLIKELLCHSTRIKFTH